MQLTLTTLSPLHIGTGNMLEPFEYYIENQNIFVLDLDACSRALLDDDPDNIDRFSNWVDGTSDKIAKADREAREARRSRNRKLSMDKNQLIARLRSEFNIVDFARNILGKKELAEHFIKDQKYHRYQAFMPNRPRNVVQLKEMIKTNNVPYIPGSSIKGSIRTALAYKAIRELDKGEADLFAEPQDTRGEGLSEILGKLNDAAQEVLQAVKSNHIGKQKEAFRQLSFLRRRYEKRIGQQVEKYIFGCDDGRGRLDDPKFDIMRLIKVSDTTRQHVTMLVAEMKSFTRDGRSGGIKAQPINISEFIDSESQFSFGIEVDAQLIKILFDRQNKREWRGFERKMSRLFNLTADTVSNMNEAELEKHIIYKILDAIEIFGQAVTDKENKWLERFSPQDRRELETALEQIAAKKHRLKLGFASGWFATTVGLAIKDNQYLKNILPDIVYAFNLDLIIKDEKLLKYPAKRRRDAERQERLLRRTPDADAFPTSRRLIAQRFVPSEYIGWVELKEGQLEKMDSENKAESKKKQSYNNMDDAIEALKDHFK